MTIHPPKPRLCLRVGVTGHRPGEKFPAPAINVVAATVGEVLDRVRSATERAAEKYAEYFDGEPAPLELVIVLPRERTVSWRRQASIANFCLMWCCRFNVTNTPMISKPKNPATNI